MKAFRKQRKGLQPCQRMTLLPLQPSLCGFTKGRSLCSRPTIDSPYFQRPQRCSISWFLQPSSLCMSCLIARPGYAQWMKVRKGFPSATEINILYLGTTGGSKNCLCITRSFAYIIKSLKNGLSWSNKSFNQLFKAHNDLLLDFIDLPRKQHGTEPSDRREASPCEHHEHAKAEICPYEHKASIASICKIEENSQGHTLYL